MPLFVRIGGVTILRKGKSDLITDGEIGMEPTDSQMYYGHKMYALYYNIWVENGGMHLFGKLHMWPKQ